MFYKVSSHFTLTGGLPSHADAAVKGQQIIDWDPSKDFVDPLLCVVFLLYFPPTDTARSSDDVDFLLLLNCVLLLSFSNRKHKQ